jgi:hypothetical protein
MSENLQSRGLRFGIRLASPSVIIVTKMLFFLLLFGVVQQVAAATSSENQLAADRTKLIKICKTDIQRFCDQANLKQECLVTHWDKLSIECRSILGSSAGNRADDGS